MLHHPLLSLVFHPQLPLSPEETPANTLSCDLNVAILQSHFQLCFSGFCIRGEIVQQLPEVKTWKHASMCVCVHATFELDFVCVCFSCCVQIFTSAAQGECVYISQISSLTACALLLSLLRYALLMVAVIIMFVASAQHMLQHNVPASFLF